MTTSGELTTIARPYARAAFEYALENDALASWENMLNTAAIISEAKEVNLLLESPAMSPQTLSKLFCDILTNQINSPESHFLQLLAEYKRLPVLPAIASLFAYYRAEHEKTLDVQVVSAVPLDEKFQHVFAQKLTNRLKRKVALSCEVDDSLLGGAVIRAGGRVIDGSVRGKLNRLLESL